MRVVVAVIVVAVIAVSGGCHFYRRWAADGIAQTLRSLPGVGATDMSYQTGLTGNHFDLTADLADEVTDAQAAAVGRTFVDRMRATGFSDFNVRLTVNYKHNRDARPGLSGSSAEFEYHFDMFARGGPSSDDVATSLALWLRVAQSPGAAAVTLVQPDWGKSSNSRDVSIRIASSATDAMVSDLIRAHPELATARWVFSIPAPVEFAQPRTYTVVGPFPSQQRGELWRRIVELVGDFGSAQAVTNTIDRHPEIAPTVVEIYPSTARDEAQRVDQIVRTVVPLLPGLGLPVALRLNQIRFTLGGCERPERGRVPSALETELRRQYERC